MYLMPSAGCSWRGLGELGGKRSWIDGEMSLRVTAHELGHNFNLLHANTLLCRDGAGAAVSFSPSCAPREYLDPWDVMGAYSPTRHSHAWNLDRLGFLSQANVETVEASGRYELRSALEPSDEPVSLRIPRSRGADGEVLDHLSLDVRESGGVFDAFRLGDPVTTGVGIRLTGAAARPLWTNLLDARPRSADNFFDATLPVGQTFVASGIGITLVAMPAPGRAVVDVTVPPITDSQSPAAPPSLNGERVDTEVRLAWGLSSDDRDVAGYEVYRDGASIGTTYVAGLEDRTATSGAHVYEVAAFDSAGNFSQRSRPFVVAARPAAVSAAAPPPSTPPPSTLPRPTSTDRATPRLRLSSMRRGRGRAIVSVAAADASGIARLVLKIDGRRRKLVLGPRLRYVWSLRGVRRGRHRLMAVAVDRNGNRASKQRLVKLRR